MKLYLSIPITGYEQGNEPLARRLAASLVEKGHEVVVPHDLSAPDHPGNADVLPQVTDTPMGIAGDAWVGVLPGALLEMMLCDAVVTAPKWEDSRGCSAEVATARSVNMPVYDALEVIRGQEIVL